MRWLADTPAYQRKLRKVKRQVARTGLSQKKIAKLIGKSPAIVGFVLNGRSTSQPVLDAILSEISK